MKKGENSINPLKRKYTFGWKEMSLVKLSVLCFTLFIVSLFEQDVIDKIKGLRLLWLLLTVIFMIRPIFKMWGKK
jgi:hypothetical protein